MKNYKRLLIIPAKSTSSRIPNKNFKLFFGKPIFMYSYEAAKKSKIFDKIHISTESKKISDKLKKKGISIDFLRDQNLAKDNVGLFNVYKNTLIKYDRLGINFSEIWGLLPCSPLIDKFDLLNIHELLKKKKIKLPILSVCKYPSPIEWAFEMKKNFKLKPLNEKYFEKQSQKIKTKYFDTGNVSVFSRTDLIKNDQLSIMKKFYGYEFSKKKSIDIDYMDDWEFAKKIKKINVKKN